jgi:hypothetical protein
VNRRRWRDLLRPLIGSEVAMNSMHIKHHWELITPAIRQWFTDNPGCVILPRTISAAINESTGGNSELDPHGETVFSEEDINFIRLEGQQAATSSDEPTYRFFDSVQP